MEMTPAPSDFVADLENQLVGAAVRLESRRRALRRGLVLAAVLAAVFAGGTLVPLPGGAGGGLRQAVAIESETETVRIRLLGASADPDAVQRELAEAGIASEVDAIPASPSRVGTWVSVESGGNVDMAGDGILILRRPVGTLRLAYGRPADPGEPYHVTTSAFAPGEVLHCVELLGMPADEAARVLAEKGLEVSWRQELVGDSSSLGETPYGDEPLVGESRVVDEPPPGVVVDVSPHTSSGVIAHAADPAIADRFREPVDRTGCS